MSINQFKNKKNFYAFFMWSDAKNFYTKKSINKQIGNCKTGFQSYFWQKENKIILSMLIWDSNGEKMIFRKTSNKQNVRGGVALELILILFPGIIAIITSALMSKKWEKYEKVDKGIELCYWKLSYRRKLIRTLWMIPIAIFIVLCFYITFWSTYLDIFSCSCFCNDTADPGYV